MILLFCDSSFDPRRRQGVAAFLQVEGVDSTEPNIDNVQFSLFAETTNTRLELQGVLRALEGLADGASVKVFTDCATIPNLLARRARLESSKYTNRNGQSLANADLYQRLASECDRLVLSFQRMKGHKPAKTRSSRERTLAFVDRAARRALRSQRRKEWAEGEDIFAGIRGGTFAST